MEAKVTKVARVSVKFSKSLARRRLRPNQEKGRSTTQRRGRDDEAPHVVAPLDDLHTQRRHLLPRHQLIALATVRADAPIYDRARLGAGDRITGPAILTQLDATAPLLPGQTAEVHRFGSLVVYDQ
jgi:N-methylhydantoinase A/oxoprolinase/acetone carboxylase beta subunit